jgi:zinc protease
MKKSAEGATNIESAFPLNLISIFAVFFMQPMLNRKSAPPVHEIKHLALPQPALVGLDNGMPVYVLHYPGQEIVKIEALYRAGRPEEDKRLVARATARLVREGTARHSSAELAEAIDFYGGSLSVPVSLDTANFALFSLRKYAAELVPLFAEVLQEPVFPQQELETFCRTSVQELLVELDKGEVLTYRKITELMFGEHHPYGYNSTPADYDALTRADLQRYFEQWYTPTNGLLIVSGHVDDDLLALLNRSFGQNTRRGPGPRPYPLPASPAVASAQAGPTLHLAHPGSLQTAIKIGRRTFGRRHPDYNGLYVLNTLLGGYFGSRLMTNIREKRGYTYNIYSSLDALSHDGYFYIGAEVNTGRTAATIREIFAEMRRLREEPVPDDELAMVRSYLLGMLLNGLDGPLNTSDVVKSMLSEDLPWQAFDDLVKTIREISPEEIRALAERYLQAGELWTVTAGPPKR